MLLAIAWTLVVNCGDAPACERMVAIWAVALSPALTYLWSPMSWRRLWSLVYGDGDGVCIHGFGVYSYALKKTTNGSYSIPPFSS